MKNDAAYMNQVTYLCRKYYFFLTKNQRTMKTNDLKYSHLVQFIEDYAERLDGMKDFLPYQRLIMIDTLKKYFPNLSELSDDDLEKMAIEKYAGIISDFMEFQESDEIIF